MTRTIAVAELEPGDQVRRYMSDTTRTVNAVTVPDTCSCCLLVGFGRERVKVARTATWFLDGRATT